MKCDGDRTAGVSQSGHGEGPRVAGLCSSLDLIQVQRRCRRLYDDEEHLGDPASPQFPRCADVAPVPFCMHVRISNTLIHIRSPQLIYRGIR